MPSKRRLIKGFRFLIPPAIFLFTIILDATQSQEFTQGYLTCVAWSIGVTFMLYTLRLYDFLQFYARKPVRIVEDVSYQHRAIPDKARPLAERIQHLGFLNWGETSVDYEGFPTNPIIVWLFLNSAGTTHASLVLEKSTPIVVFTSVFPDYAHLETIYPKGSNIRQEHFRRILVTHSVEKAYEVHLSELPMMTNEHGNPLHMSSVADSIEWEAVFSNRYPQEGLVSFTLTNVRAAVGYIFYLLVWSIGFTLAYAEIGDQSALFILMGLLAIPAMVLALYGGELNT